MTTLTAYYRNFDLPWTPVDEESSRLRRLLVISLVVTVLLCLIMPMLPVPERSTQEVESVPPRFAKLVLERKPPPPPPKVEPPKPEPVAEQTRPKPVVQVPQPVVDRTQRAREQAKNSGLLAVQDQLAALRDNSVVTKAVAQTRNLTGAVGETTRSERSLITSKVGAGSGGINNAALSRGYGGGTGSLTGHDTTQVTSALGSADGRSEVSRNSASTRAARSREEIELIFDRNKGAIYALYSRALREMPDLKGKVVLEITISPSGEVTRCEIVSSELANADLERKLVARVKMFRFEERDVETITTTKPIDFFPAA